MSIILDAQDAIDQMFEVEQQKFKAIEENYNQRKQEIDESLNASISVGVKSGQKLTSEVEQRIRMVRPRVSLSFFLTYSSLSRSSVSSVSSESTIREAMPSSSPTPSDMATSRMKSTEA